MNPITNITFKPFVHPNEVHPDRKLIHLTQDEEVLNWKSVDMVAENDNLHNLDKMVDKISEKIDETYDYLEALS